MNLQPQPGSAEEREAFAALQTRFQQEYSRVFADPRIPRTVVVVPSMSMPTEELLKISGVHHYEERMLCMLLLLHMPTTHVVFVTSQPIRPAIIDYYLHMLPGVPAAHAWSRLTLLDAADTSIVPLSQKILDRPRMLERIRSKIVSPETSHMTCFNATTLERTVSVQLGLPMYNADPELHDLGSKSGARTLFKDRGIPHPAGFEHLQDEDDVVEAVVELKGSQPELRRAVVKLNEGFSGEGNAVLRFDSEERMAKSEVHRRLRRSLQFEAEGETYEAFMSKIEDDGGIVEEFIAGKHKTSPSVQYRIDPHGTPIELSSHDQVLGGRAGQVYLGCKFPADEAYRAEIQEHGSNVAQSLAKQGVIGRFGVDFVSVRKRGDWRHYAIEINLRKGGTTLPNLMLEFLTKGAYDPGTGLYTNPDGHQRAYVASDNVENPSYRGLLPTDLMDIAVYNGIHFDPANQRGVFFHLLGALSEFGKLGMMAVAESPEEANALYDQAIAVLDRETN